MPKLVLYAKVQGTVDGVETAIPVVASMEVDLDWIPFDAKHVGLVKKGKRPLDIFEILIDDDAGFFRKC